MSILALLSGFSKAASQNQQQQMEQWGRQQQNIMGYWKSMLDNPNLDPRHVTTAAQRLMQASTLPYGKKFPKELTSIEDLVKPTEYPGAPSQAPPSSQVQMGEIPASTIPSLVSSEAITPPPVGMPGQEASASPFAVPGKLFRSAGEMMDEQIQARVRAMQQVGPLEAQQAGDVAGATASAQFPYKIAEIQAGIRPPAPPRPLTVAPGAGVYDPAGQKWIMEPSEKPTGNEPLDRRHAALLFKQKQGAMTPEEQKELDAIKEARSYVSQTGASFRFDLQHPGASEKEIKYIAGEIERDANTWPMLVGTDKMLQRQVKAELANRGVPVHKLSSTMSSMGEAAKVVVPKMDKIIEGIKRIAPSLGPLSGRLNDLMVRRVGVADPEFAKLWSQTVLAVTGTMKAHIGARPGQQLFEHFQELINIRIMDAPTLIASLEGVRDFLSGYRDLVYGSRAVPVMPSPGTRPPLSDFEK